MKIYVQIRRQLFFKVPMLDQIYSPYGVLWITKTKNQDWDTMKLHTLVGTLQFCHPIQDFLVFRSVQRVPYCQCVVHM